MVERSTPKAEPPAADRTSLRHRIRDADPSWWLSILCPCGRSNPNFVSIATLVEQGRGGLTLVQAAASLRCVGCRGRPPTVHPVDVGPWRAPHMPREAPTINVEMVGGGKPAL